MQERIDVQAADPAAPTLLRGAWLDGSASSLGQRFEFCMCNPPFYANDLEAQGLLPDRGSERPLPSSISTASEAERVASGGEVGHVSRIILESLQLQQRIG